MSEASDEYIHTASKGCCNNISWPLLSSVQRVKYTLSLPFLLSNSTKVPSSIIGVRTKGYSTDLLVDPTQVESKESSQIQWPVPSINAEPVDIFLGEE